MVALILGALVLVLLTALVTWVASDSTIGVVVRSRVRRTVVVTTKSGSSFRGVLMQVDRHAFVLRNTEALGKAEGGTHLLVDGELVVLRSDIEYVQLP